MYLKAMEGGPMYGMNNRKFSAIVLTLIISQQSTLKFSVGFKISPKFSRTYQQKFVLSTLDVL